MRRGLVWSQVVIITVFAAAFVAALYLVGQLVYGWNDTFDDREACKLSVIGHAATTVHVAGQEPFGELISIDCKRRLVEIGEEHVEVNGEKALFWNGTKYVKTYDDLTPTVVNAVVADELAGCWYQFLAGKTDFLGGPTLDLWNDDKACFICSELRMGRDLAPYGVDLERMLAQQRVRKAYVTEELSVASYLFNEETICADTFDRGDEPCITQYFKGRAESDDPLSNTLTFEPLKEYSIVFYREGGGWLNQYTRKRPEIAVMIGLATRSAGSAITYLLVPEESATYFAWVVPSNELNSDLCGSYFA